MEELVLFGEVPKGARLSRDLKLAGPLLEYLDSLRESQDRPLEWHEDELALYHLRRLFPDGPPCPQIAWFVRRDNRRNRTLTQWYGLVRHVVEHLQLDD